MTERARYDNEDLRDNDRSWLERLEPGDQVIVQEHGRDYLSSVDARLPSGRLLVSWGGGTREFNLAGRLHTSGTYSSTCLVEPTPYRKDMIEKQHLARYLAEQQWHQLPLDPLRQIAALIGQ
jgi:hypothetical protein